MKLEDLQKLCDEATPGKWEGGTIGVDDAKGQLIADCDNQAPSRLTLKADIAFIAAARTAMPLLIEIARIADALRTKHPPDLGDPFREACNCWSCRFNRVFDVLEQA